MNIGKILNDPTAASLLFWFLGMVVVEMAILFLAEHYYRQAKAAGGMAEPTDGSVSPAKKAKRTMYLFIGLLPFPIGMIILLDMYLAGRLPT